MNDCQGDIKLSASNLRTSLDKMLNKHEVDGVENIALLSYVDSGNLSSHIQLATSKNLIIDKSADIQKTHLSSDDVSSPRSIRHGNNLVSTTCSRYMASNTNWTPVNGFEDRTSQCCGILHPLPDPKDNVGINVKDTVEGNVEKIEMHRETVLSTAINHQTDIMGLRDSESEDCLHVNVSYLDREERVDNSHDEKETQHSHLPDCGTH